MVKDEILQLEFVGFGIAAGLFVPGYMDGGYGLVVLTLILAGAAMQWLYNRARSGRPEWLGVYAFAVANATLSVYGTLVNSFSVLLIPAIVFSVLWLSNRRIVLSLSPLEAVRAWPRVVVGVTGACLMGLILMTAVGFATASNLGTNQSDGGVMGHDGEEILIPATGC